MSAWRREAIEFLPEYKETIEKAQSPSELWIELGNYFELAFRNSDKETITCILKFMRYALANAKDNSPSSSKQAIYCGFLEELARNKQYWNEFNKWFSRVEYLDYRNSFGYTLSEKEMKELDDLFYAK